jgi:hypothetical protein
MLSDGWGSRKAASSLDQPLRDLLRIPKVHHCDLLGRADHYVLGLDIQMCNALCVHKNHHASNLPQNIDDFPFRQQAILL